MLGISLVRASVDCGEVFNCTSICLLGWLDRGSFSVFGCAALFNALCCNKLAASDWSDSTRLYLTGWGALKEDKVSALLNTDIMISAAFSICSLLIRW